MKLLLVAALFFLAGSSAEACSERQKEVDRHSRLLKEQNERLIALTTKLTLLETRCQRSQKDIAEKNANAASAEACEALRETAGMQNELKEKSESCAMEQHELEKEIESLNVKQLAPLSFTIDYSRSLDEIFPLSASFCPQQVSETKKLKQYGAALLARSVASEARARASVAKFQALGVTTWALRDRSQATLERCASDGNVAKASSQPAKGAPVAVPPPSGGQRVPASTITGKIKKDELP